MERGAKAQMSGTDGELGKGSTHIAEMAMTNQNHQRRDVEYTAGGRGVDLPGHGPCVSREQGWVGSGEVLVTFTKMAQWARRQSASLLLLTANVVVATASRPHPRFVTRRPRVYTRPGCNTFGLMTRLLLLRREPRSRGYVFRSSWPL